jgi:hypothetical protein
LAHLPLSSLIHFGGEGPPDRGGEFITLEGDTGVVAVKAGSKGASFRTGAIFLRVEPGLKVGRKEGARIVWKLKVNVLSRGRCNRRA